MNVVLSTRSQAHAYVAAWLLVPRRRCMHVCVRACAFHARCSISCRAGLAPCSCCTACVACVALFRAMTASRAPSLMCSPPSPARVAAIANAQTLEEIQRLEEALKTGHLPSEVSLDGQKQNGGAAPEPMEVG
jgi:hypothetical protein